MATTPSYFLNWGLISVGVKSYVAARDYQSPLVNLHQKCSARLNALSKCSACQEVVDKADVVKGYPVKDAKATYVQIQPTEIEALLADSSKAMEIKGFVKAGSIDAVYIGRSNYIGPADPAGARAFGLLKKAMEIAKTDAIVQFVGSNREKIGLLRVYGDTLMLFELFYESEVRSFESQNKVPLAAEPNDMELALAAKLLKAGMIEPEIKQYKDSYVDKLQELIDSKINGTEAPKPVERPAVPQGTDLMAALRASLEAKEAA
jgi:DNA end-binding protein Ku